MIRKLIAPILSPKRCNQYRFRLSRSPYVFILRNKIYRYRDHPFSPAVLYIYTLLYTPIIFIYLFFVWCAGEVERLLRDYRQNQELVRNIGANYYQIIYPVQIRHHDKMGISTREVGSQKVSFGVQYENSSRMYMCVCARARERLGG